MRQLCRDRRGRARLVEVPTPTPREGERLVRVSHALLAPWTEVQTTTTRRQVGSVLETAQEVIGYIAQAGLRNTLAFARAARADLRPSGFSASGILVEEGGAPGLPVLCAGPGLCAHAEYLVASSDQIVPLPPSATAKAGALAALGVGALVALDRLDVAQSGRVVVVGLGNWGRMAVLAASRLGYEVAAVDGRDERLVWARAHGAKEAVQPSSLSTLLGSASEGGVAVLLATGSMPPHLVASGHVVPLDGNLLADGERLPRGLRQFADQLAQGWAPEEELGLPTVRFADAAGARAPALLEMATPKEPLSRLSLRAVPPSRGAIGVGLAGCGTFAKLHHLPNLTRDPGFRLAGIASRSALNALVVARSFGAAYCTTDIGVLLRDPAIELIFLTGRHDEHVALLLETARAGKPAFVEKPVATTEEGCTLLEGAADTLWASVGFNRRFAPLAEEAKAKLSGRRGPAFLNYRVNFGPPVANWFRDPAKGGGRLVAAACHYVDLATWMLESRPVRVFAESAGSAAPGSPEEQDTVVSVVRYTDGSLFSLSFSSLGRRQGAPKEEIEAHWDGSVFRLTEFHSLTVNGRTRRLLRRDLGERRQLSALAAAFRAGAPPPVPLSQGIVATRLTLQMLKSLRAVAAIPVREP
ncbi:MAG: Gfo/Idh/MocA family oxidoreductase [Candidatus Rokubacteria bacterium]|nr:Gfo/Idh/MocA family oxidoreductase [Candidatus Rokubacteria bacterium]